MATISKGCNEPSPTLNEQLRKSKMPNITISVPAGQATRVQNAFASRVGKDAADVTLADVKGELVSIIKLVVKQAEQDAARAAAVDSDVDVDVT